MHENGKIRYVETIQGVEEEEVKENVRGGSIQL
jgi:hypothetical protein